MAAAVPEEEPPHEEIGDGVSVADKPNVGASAAEGRGLTFDERGEDGAAQTREGAKRHVVRVETVDVAEESTGDAERAHARHGDREHQHGRHLPSSGDEPARGERER